MKRLILSATALIGLIALVTGAHMAMAATTNGTNSTVGQALEIAPPVVTLSADPGQTITTQISLRGVVQQKLIVTSQVNDFTAAGEDGTPKILIDVPDGEVSPYSLRSWINPLPELTLEARQIKNMSVTIHVPANAAPGGYYGVVRFTATAPELKDTGVALSASLGSLIFLKVNGTAKEGLNLETFTVGDNNHTGSLFEGTPLTFAERLKNTGNTNLEPAGQIVIKDMFGQKIATVNVNLPPHFILPQTIRKFDQPLDNTVIGDKYMFGKYTAELHLTYGDSKQTVTSTVEFWVIPYRLIGFVVLGLIAAFLGIRYALRRYNRSIIRRSQGGGLRMGGKRK